MMSDERARVVVLISTSVDARVAFGPRRTWIDEGTDPRGRWEGRDREDGDAVWHEAEAYITRTWHPRGDMQGTGSFVREGDPLDPLPPFEGDPAPLYADYMPDHLAERARELGWLIVTDGRGRLRGGYKGDEHPNAHMLHLTSRAAPPEYLAFLRGREIPYMMVGEGRVDLPRAMRRLRAELGIETVRSTAGGHLNGALLRAGLVDELNLILRPEAIGGSETPALFDGPDLAPDEPQTRLRLDAALVRGNFLWLRYSTG
jgi:riboflavin biosynthesis pyrimidine reductase